MKTEVRKVSAKDITQFKANENPIFKKDEKIFKQNNIGTIIPNDALRNINLSTIPSIIQDAIDKMGLSVETNILASALLLQIQRDIENLGDAIVEKSYIDGQVTYLTDIISQKSDSGDVASIVDSKLAIVTEDLATANQVNNLNTRLNDSQSSINQINQTINTKEEALVSMIEQAEANVDENLSNYSVVLNLTVDSDGKVVSQRLESIEAQNARTKISITEDNKIVLDEDGSFTSYVSKFINDEYGNVTGYHFSDSDDAQSSFTINADTFKISSSDEKYTPFRIEDENIYFNGRVAFTSIQSTTEDWQQQVQEAINNNATYIDGSKIVTNDAFVNNLNAVGGINADTVSANAIQGTTIQGATLIGAVIKASYIDLDGELEILTDYKITVAMYNANPALYKDAVYIKGDNNYRIPSLSSISSIEKTVSNGAYNLPAGTYKLSSSLWSYATANVGNNLKAVRVRPVLNISASDELYNNGNLTLDTNQIYNIFFSGYLGTSSIGGSFTFAIGNLVLLNIVINGTIGSPAVTYSGLMGSGNLNTVGDRNLSYGGMSFILGASNGLGNGSAYQISLRYSGIGKITPNANWTSGEIYIQAVTTVTGSLQGLRLPVISINNMV